MSNMKLIKECMADPSMLSLGENIYFAGTLGTLGIDPDWLPFTIFYINKTDLERSNPKDYVKEYYTYIPNDFETTLSYSPAFSAGIFKTGSIIKLLFNSYRSDAGETTCFLSDMQSNGTYGKAYLINPGYTDRPHSYIGAYDSNVTSDVRSKRIRIADYVYEDYWFNPQDLRNPVWLLYTWFDNGNKVAGWEMGGQWANNSVIKFVNAPTDSSMESIVEGGCLFSRTDAYGTTWKYLTYSEDHYLARYNTQWRKAKTIFDLQYAEDHCLMGSNGVPILYTNGAGLKSVNKNYGGARIVTYNWQGQNKVKIMYHVGLPAPGYDAIHLDGVNPHFSIQRHTVVEDLEFTANGDIIDLAIPNL